MNIFLLNILLFSSLFIKNFGFPNFFSKTEEIKSSTKSIKVLLHKLPAGSVLKVSSIKGFSVQERVNKKAKSYGSPITLGYNKNGITINGNLYKTEISVIAHNSLMELNKKVYQGSFIIKPENNNALIINQLHLEDYVFSVLKTESWPGWPLEVNKVQAIVCRTYVLSMIEDAKKTKRSYHVTNTNLFQTYSGIHKNSTIRKAVDETKAMVIHYDKKPILAMYDSCCGGITPAHVSSFDFNKKPYLARTYACTYCKNCNLYKWQTTIPAQKVAQHIDPKALSIQSIKVTKKDKAGIAQEILLKGKGLSTTVTGQKIYSLSKDIKSFYFDVYKKSNNIVFFGRGYGHHIGLCQWGAREMVKKGYGFKKILSYYYPGTSIGKII